MHNQEPILSPTVAEKPTALLKKEAIARELQCSPRHIERLQRAKKIPVIRISAKCVRYRLAGVLAALSKLETEAVE